ncbi:hypothetical protein [Seonamhaeicola sp. ML3]|uniref:hypothetical protein n=1 Tax=Seonamhaeicola sp. ML3 TaxID=2937786 RepID=UPI00200E020B|nr:hypothetical protein [Seonamhaeicola sp. ML3]
MNLNPFIWISKKYLQEVITKEVTPISSLTNKLEKENIGLNHHVKDHKERISKLEDRLREYEIKISSFNTAIDVVRRLNSNNQNNINNNLLDNE